MAIQFATAATAIATGAVTSLTVNVPSGTVNGDQLILWATNGDGVTFNTPSGWTLLQQTNDQNIVDAAMWRRTAASEPASYAVTTGSATRIVAAILRYTGVNTIVLERGDTISSVGAGFSTTSTAPVAVSGVVATDMVMTAYHTGPENTANYTLTAPASGSWTQRVNIVGTTTGFDPGLVVVDKRGGTDVPTATASANNAWIETRVAFREAIYPDHRLIDRAALIRASYW